jgi:NAD(P)-dependent dehydrogenase (short-subunit alcohol dehydrogenase family)
MKAPFSLDNKTAIITGGASGIGASIAQVFAQQGAQVHILDINAEAGASITKAINEQKGQAFFHSCDITDQEKVNATFESIGQLDILVNNAAIAHIGNVETTTAADMDKIYEVNIKSVYHCLQAGVKMMKEKGGAILNMASVASILGIQDRFAYSTSKGAVLTMTYSIAKDYLQHNIRCNAIGPARVHTPFVDGYLKDNYPGREEEMYQALAQTQPIGRMGKPEEIAYLALYLCSDEAGFITGSFYPIDGGFITLNT